MNDAKKSGALKGILLALAAALAVSNVYIFSKAALKEIHIAQFGVYWFGLGIIWNLIYIFVFGKQRGLKKLSGNSWLVLLLIAVLEMFGTVLFFMAINKVENPAVVSFLANVNPLLITTLGILMLHERFNKIEFIGMVITLSGAVMISYKGGTTLSKLLIPGTEYVWLSGIIYSFSSIIAKKNITKLDPSFLSMARLILLFVLSLVMMFSLGLSFEISDSALKNVAIGSVLGPFLTALLGYLTMKYIEVSKASIVRSVRSLFVLAGAYLYFGSFPTQIQIIGGLLTISGVIFISLGKLKKKTN
jgi:drug/metabolite transporter (DMT)-like permease